MLSPFAGIGSEGYVSVQLGRRFIGFELKSSYWSVACENLEIAEREYLDGNADLFTVAENR